MIKELALMKRNFFPEEFSNCLEQKLNAKHDDIRIESILQQTQYDVERKIIQTKIARIT